MVTNTGHPPNLPWFFTLDHRVVSFPPISNSDSRSDSRQQLASTHFNRLPNGRDDFHPRLKMGSTPEVESGLRAFIPKKQPLYESTVQGYTP